MKSLMHDNESISMYKCALYFNFLCKNLINRHRFENHRLIEYLKILANLLEDFQQGNNDLRAYLGYHENTILKCFSFHKR